MSAGFRVSGFVSRAFVPPSGKCAFLTVEFTNDRGRTTKIETRTFEADIIAAVRDLGQGEEVEVTGSIESEVLKNKAKQDVSVDGRSVWVPMLKLTAIKANAKPKPAPAASFDSDNDIPF